MYPMETLRKEVQRYTENHVNSGRALAELGHPDGPTVNLDRVSHKIVSLRENGSNFMVKQKFLAPLWVRLHKILLMKVSNWVFHPEALVLSKPTREGVNVVGDDFMLATAADIVADPSAPDAFVEGIMEGKDWVWDGGVL